MNDNTDNNPQSNRRVCDRLDLRRKMLLELENGEILVGESEDISLRGVLLRCADQTDSDPSGMSGALYLFGDGGARSSGFACRVIRLKGDCLALELDRKVVAAFGQYLTRDLFKR